MWIQIRDFFISSNIVGILYVINFFVGMTIIFLERKDPSATLAWLAVLFGLPGVGLFLYIFFSQNIARQKIFKFTEDEESIMTNSLAKQNRRIKEGTYEFREKAAVQWSDLIELNQNYGRAYYTQNNDVQIFADGNRMFDKMLQDIAEAKESIHFMFFILKNDEMGKKIIDALTEKAKEGVDVKLLLDALGSRQINERVVSRFLLAGGQFATFFPPRNKFLKVFNSRFNYRNHRKLVVIDNEIGYIGGFNVAREYVGLKKKFGFWRDTHLRIRGGAVQDMNARFMLDWRASSEVPVDITSNFYETEHEDDVIGMQIVSSGPDSEHEEIKRAFLKMISGAKKNICIQTPYFVPDAPIMESLKMASQSGIDVKIMIPCMPDHIFVYWATYSYVGEIIKNGGRVFIYDAGFLHAKTMTVDGQVATVGSTNFDNRSFRLNFEANAFIYDENVTKKLDTIFEKDIESCHELTWELYCQRSRWIKIKEAISRLLTAIL